MSDPADVVASIERAEDAFEYRGHGRPDFSDGIDSDEEWTTQLTKGCRYLETCSGLRDRGGFDGAVVELAFAAIERTLEAFLLWDTDASLVEFQDHEEVYDRVVPRGLFEPETADDLKQLYSTNRTEHYYGGTIPTRQQADAMYVLAGSVHEYVGSQIRVGGICTCR